ncbi:MAG: hypothetical protein ACFB0Z_14995 [Candidatus Phaeomarinobacter sp.]
MKQGVYLDDDDSQREIYKGLLSDENIDFSSTVIPSSMASLISDIAEISPDIVVMDYRLDGTRHPEWHNDFKAGGVAQVLRDKFVESPESDIPLVLLSTEANIQSLFVPDKTSHDLFDIWFLKNELHEDSPIGREIVLPKLAALVDGYELIKREVSGDDPAILAPGLLALEKEEYLELQPDGLKPVLLNSDGLPERAHVVARQIFQNVVKHSGILLDRDGLRARLGLTVESFERLCQSVSFEELRYEGVFSNGWERYWKHRYEQWEANSFDVLLGSLTGEKRALLLEEKFDVQCEPAVSRWSKSSSEYFSFACHVCRQPTEQRHSVAVFEPRLLPFMERRRVCYDCVETETEMRRMHIRVSETDEATVDAIRDERLPKPTEGEE